MAIAERKSNIRLTKDNPYLALTGELWGVFCEDFEENWPRFNGTALYTAIMELPNCVAVKTVAIYLYVDLILLPI